MELKKSYFLNKYCFIFLGTALVVFGFFGYQAYSNKQAVHNDVIDSFEESIPAKCENGEWIEFPDLEKPEQYEKFVGNDRLKYDEKKEVFDGADGARTFSTDANYSLFFFMDRDVRIEGYALRDSEIYVKKIKCVGVETNKDVLQARRKLMNYVKDNINTLALEKGPKNDWVVETFYFINDTDVYVQYESESSFEDDSLYDSRLWLIRASELDRDIPVIETLAYIQEDAEDPEKNIVKQGKDLYADAKNLTIYEFDEDANQWMLQ